MSSIGDDFDRFDEPFNIAQVSPMATAESSANPTDEDRTLRDAWLERLTQLVTSVRDWAEAADWATRVIQKRMEDSRLGVYKAPALLLQKETARVFLEPIARSAPGTDGVVDLYLMPAYDDIARLCFENGEWRLHETSSGSAFANEEEDSKPLTKDSLGQALERLMSDAGNR